MLSEYVCAHIGQSRPNSGLGFHFPDCRVCTTFARQRGGGRNVQRCRGGLVFKAHRLCVSLNSRLESNDEEEEGPPSVNCVIINKYKVYK